MIPKNVILIRPDRLGDLILSLPTAKALKDTFPDCRVSYLAAPGPAAVRTMVEYIDGWIVDENENGGRLKFASLAGILRREKFDCLIELKPSWRTASAGAFAGIPIRIGTSRRFYSFFYNTPVGLHRRGSGRHQADLDLAMLTPLGIEISGKFPELSVPDGAKQLTGKLVGKGVGDYIVIHPGSGGSAPNWPLRFYAELAALITKSRSLKVVITGMEKPSGDFPGCLDLRGQTRLDELSGLLACARLFISGSTGPLHLADALGTPCVSFFVDRADIGPSRWGPRRNLERVLTPSGGACRCQNLEDCRCLETITPGDALNKVESILGL